MVDVFKTLLKINDMKKRAAEQAQAELAYRIYDIEGQIEQIHESIDTKAALIDNNSDTVHTDILALENWKQAQKRRMREHRKSLEALREQQASLKKDLSKLLVQETSFKRILSEQKKTKALVQDNMRDEANNAIWVQNHRMK